jgi:hypothetical protein
VTDLAVSDHSPDPSSDHRPDPTPNHEVVPGDQVRELVDRKERDLELLRLELHAALQEAAEAELRLAQRPDGAVPAEEGSTPPAPRTTVVTRLPMPAPEARPAHDRGPAHRRSNSAVAEAELGWLRFLGTHVIVKLGIALAVLALVLLFFA